MSEILEIVTSNTTGMHLILDGRMAQRTRFTVSHFHWAGAMVASSALPCFGGHH